MHHDSDVVPFFVDKSKRTLGNRNLFHFLSFLSSSHSFAVEQEEVDLSSLIQKEMERLGLTSGAYLSFSKLTYSVKQPVRTHLSSFSFSFTFHSFISCSCRSAREIL